MNDSTKGNGASLPVIPALHPDAAHPEVPLAERVCKVSATGLLGRGVAILADRAKEYDVNGKEERSIASVVMAFNAITGHDLTETHGWLFMALLKAKRGLITPQFHLDSAVDGVNYMALMGEARAREFGL